MAAIALPYRTAAGAIPYGEMTGYREDFTQDMPQSTRVLITSWQDRDAFPVAMLGDVSHGGAGNSFNRSIPERHPDPKFGFCVELRLTQGLGAPVKDGARELISYQDTVNNLEGVAVWEATYRPLPYSILANDALAGQKGGDPGMGAEMRRYVIREFEFGVEVYQLPGTAYKWAELIPDKATGVLREVDISEPVPYQRPLDTLKYTWVLVPDPIPLFFLEVIGKLNNADFDGYPAGSLLCLPPEITEPKFTASGQTYRNITYNLVLRPDSGWNKFFNAALTKYVFLREKKTNEPGPYKPAAFETLFRVKF